MEADGRIGRYAIGGAMAAVFYVEPFTTFDRVHRRVRAMSKDIDISEILRKKEARRRALARLPFEEKVDIVRRLQRLCLEIKESRGENERLRRARESARER